MIKGRRVYETYEGIFGTIIAQKSYDGVSPEDMPLEPMYVVAWDNGDETVCDLGWLVPADGEDFE